MKDNYVKVKDLKEEFKMIQELISKWDEYSLTIKNCTILLWSAITVFIGTQYYTFLKDGINLSQLFWIPLVLPFPFWIFDALFKYFQRSSISRSDAIHDYLNNSFHITIKKQRKSLAEEVKRHNKQNKNSKQKTWIAKEMKEFKDKFPIYDLVSQNSRKFLFFRAKYDYITKFLPCFFVRIVSTVYLVLISLSFLVRSTVLNDWLIPSFKKV